MTLGDPGVAHANGSFADETDTQAGAEARADAEADGHVATEPDETLLGAAGSAVGPLLAAFEEAGPEAAEHLVNAAHEFSLAVKVVVDALEQGLAEQREALAGQPPSPPPPGTRAPGQASSEVRRIDVE